jgi:holo-[acyl-carrier protein] synthase
MPPSSFAAKEAVIKAHPALKPTFHRIVIARQAGPGTAVWGGLADTVAGADKAGQAQEPSGGSGPPVAIVRGEDDADAGQQALVSISHDGAYATAVCIGFEAAHSP